MKTYLVREDELKSQEFEMPEAPTVMFKMVCVGSNTLKENQYSPQKICSIANAQAGFFLFGESTSDLRKGMHELVDKFCNAMESSK
jgi:hypothetical protein